MTTLPAVSPGIVAPPLPDASPLDTPSGVPHTQAAPPGAPATAADMLARFGAEQNLHPLAQQQFKQAAPGGAGGVGGAQLQKGVPDAAARTWDVHTTSQADIDALKRSPDPKQQRLGHTIENAKAAYGDLLGKNDGARIVVTMNAGNGGEPVMTLMGRGFDPKLPVRVHTHYHGDNATVADPEGSKAGQNTRIRATLARDPQTVFILPECESAKPTPDGPKNNLKYTADWSNVKSQADTTDIALAAAGISKGKIEKETVSVHSRGGNVIHNMMEQDDGSGRKLRADRLEMHDSLYGSQDAVVRWGKTENGKQVEKVVYVHGNNGGVQGDGRDREIAKAFKGAYLRIDVGLLKPAHDTTRDGKPAYNADPHYQTTGRFLAIWPLPN